MKPKTVVKITVDAAMFVLFLLLMERHLIDGVAHEWLGISVGIVFLLHNALNYRWYKSLFKGRYTAERTIRTAINLLLWIGMLGCMISGMLVSVSLFPSAGGNAIELGRKLHLISTAWAFIIICIHLGLHWSMFTGISKRIPLPDSVRTVFRWLARAAVSALCVWGVFVFAERNFWEEMFLLIDYQKEYDYTKSPVSYFFESAAFASLIVAITYYTKKLFLFICRKRRQKETIQ